MWRGEGTISPGILLSMAHQVRGYKELNGALQLVNQGISTFYAHSIALCYFWFDKDDLNPLCVNMSMTGGMEAELILDRFFAMVGISEEIPDDFVDYTRTVAEVASQVGLMALLGSPEFPTADGLDLLARWPGLSLRSRQIEIPTWVPDQLSGPYQGLSIPSWYSTGRFRSKHPDFPVPQLQIVTGEDSNNQPRPLTSSDYPYRFPKVRGLRQR
jgi:hypothetical protein